MPSSIPQRACAACDARLAVDQRYCLDCGERVGDLPPDVAALLGQGRAPEPDEPRGLALVSPRAAALAVLAVLGFGSIVGTVVSPPASSEAAAPVLVAVAAPAAPTPAPAPIAPPTPKPPHVDAGSDDTPSSPSPPAAKATPAPKHDDPSPKAPAPTTTTTSDGDPDIKHVFLIMLSGHGYDEAFGPSSPAPYLAKTLPKQGEVVQNYYAATQGELANGIALISGQGPTAQTQLNCPNLTDVTPTGTGDDDQVLGAGCVYPAATKTLGDQLTDAKKTWKAYVEDPADPAAPPADPVTCRRTDDASYAGWRNPFNYFHSLLDGGGCAKTDVALSQLDFELTSAATTPSLSYIVPNRCHDGSTTPCADGQPAGLPAADAWLKTIVPTIMKSKAYADGGLIAITFDQAPEDTTSCCTPAAFPNLASSAAPATTAVPATTVLPATTTAAPPSTSTAGTPASTAVPGDTAADGLSSPGGGKVGLLLLSSAVQPGTVDRLGSYNHFSLLRSIEDLFGLDHLGYAKDPAMPSFDKVVYNAKSS